MMRVWLAAGAMLLAFIAAQVLTPEPAAGGAGIRLESLLPDRAGDWRLDEALEPVLPREADRSPLARRIYDQTVARTYRNSRGERVMLVIAYGSNQSDALQLHLPEICYAAQGFLVVPAGRGRIALDAGGAVPVRRLATRRGARQEPVTYWTRVGDRVSLDTLSRQWSKLAYGLRGRIPDGVLVRVSSISEPDAQTFARHDAFIREWLRTVAPAERPFFLGAR